MWGLDGHGHCVDMGGDGHCSVSSFCDSGGMLFCGCGLSMRGVGAIGMRGVDIINAGDAVGTGGSCCGVHGWGEVGTACWGLFLGCGGQLGAWWAISSMCLPLSNRLLSRAVAGACFEMARVR